MLGETQLCRFSQPQPEGVLWQSGMALPYQLQVPPLAPPLLLPPVFPPVLPPLLPELPPVFPPESLGATALPVFGSILPGHKPLDCNPEAICAMALLVLL